MTRMKEAYDLVVVGGGPAGMIAAAALAETGRTVLLVDATPENVPPDLRSTAFLMPNVRMLEKIGVFDVLRPLAARLARMQVADAAGDPPVIREIAGFDASELGEDQFGFNIPNAPLKKALFEHLSDRPGVVLRMGTRVVSYLARDQEAILRLSDGSSIRTKLVIAADGRNSALRDAAGIRTTQINYGQKAVVCSIHHDLPHNDISTEIHQRGGPFTTVPLSGGDGHHSAIVWMDDARMSMARMDLSDEDFNTALNTRSTGILGQMRLISKRAAWPIISQFAERLTAPRMALIAEAAHVVPPIGAQGLNMSLADIKSLSELALGSDDPGAPDVLDRYQRARWVEMRLRVQGIDVLNRTSIQSGAFAAIRQRGISFLAQKSPVRQAAMRAGFSQSILPDLKSTIRAPSPR